MRETYQPTTISPAGPPYDHTPGATTTLSYHRRKSTQCNRVQRTTTKTRARPRARTRGNGVPFPFSQPGCAQVAADWTLRHSRPVPSFPPGPVIPAHTHVIPTHTQRHSHTHPTSFPRRRESIPPKQIPHTVWSHRLPVIPPINQTELFPILCC